MRAFGVLPQPTSPEGKGSAAFTAERELRHGRPFVHRQRQINGRRGQINGAASSPTQMTALQNPAMHTRATPARRASTFRAADRWQAGFTLIEVLVAILVLSFGMLGVIGLQAAAMQANKDARYQSTAVRLGREYAEMMRANKAVASQASSTNNPYLIVNTTPATWPTDCFANACGDDPTSGSGLTNRTKIAKYEVKEWFNRASGPDGLPGLRVDVCFDTNPYDNVGRPQWTCTAPGTITRGSPVYVKIGWAVTNRGGDGGSTAFVTAASSGRPQVIVPAQMN